MSLCVRCKTPSKTTETPPFLPISYPALAGLIGTASWDQQGIQPASVFVFVPPEEGRWEGEERDKGEKS